MITYDSKIFKPISNTNNGETSSETTFLYKQIGSILQVEYSGGRIQLGHIIGLVDEYGNIDMQYHQVNDRGDIMTGNCKLVPEVLENGKLRLHETWEWTSGDKLKGKSILEEQ